MGHKCNSVCIYLGFIFVEQVGRRSFNRREEAAGLAFLREAEPAPVSRNFSAQEQECHFGSSLGYWGAFNGSVSSSKIITGMLPGCKDNL